MKRLIKLELCRGKAALDKKKNTSLSIVVTPLHFNMSNSVFGALLSECDLRRRVVLQEAGLALLTGVGIETEEALFQGHLQLLFVGMRLTGGQGSKLFL